MRRPLPLTWPSSAIGALPSVSGALVASFFIARGQVLPDRLPDRLTLPQSILEGSGRASKRPRPGSRGSARVRQGLRAGSGGDRVEARRQPILERDVAAAGSSRRTRPLCGSEGDRKSGVGRRGDQSAVREAPAQPNCLTRTCLHVDVAACLREGPAVRRDAPAPASKGSALVEMSTSGASKSRSVRGDLTP